MTVKRFYVDSPNFSQTAVVMQSFKKVYGDSIEKIFIKNTKAQIVLKPEGDIQNIFIFAKSSSDIPKGTNPIRLEDFIKHYFTRENNH